MYEVFSVCFRCTWCFPLVVSCLTVSSGSIPHLFVVQQQMNSQLHVFLLTATVCVCVWFRRVHRPLGMHHFPALPSSSSFLTPSSSYKAAQRPIRGAPPLIRVTNWGLAGAETPPHLHGHVTFKEVRRVKGRVVGGRGEGGVRLVWLSRWRERLEEENLTEHEVYSSDF